MELKLQTEPCAIVAAVFLGVRALENSTTSASQPVAIAAILSIGLLTTTAVYAIAKSIVHRLAAAPQHFQRA